MKVTGRGGSTASASAKMPRTSSGVACPAASWPPVPVSAFAYAVFSTTSRPPLWTTTAPTPPCCPGRRTTRSAGAAALGTGSGFGGSGFAAQAAASAPARRRPARRRRCPPLRRAVARTNDELRAANPEDRGRRLDAHGIGRLLGDAPRHDGERPLREGRLERGRLVVLVDEALDRQHAVRASREERVIGQRDPDRPVRPGHERVGLPDAAADERELPLPGAVDVDRALHGLDPADVLGPALAGRQHDQRRSEDRDQPSPCPESSSSVRPHSAPPLTGSSAGSPGPPAGPCSGWVLAPPGARTAGAARSPIIPRGRMRRPADTNRG